MSRASSQAPACVIRPSSVNSFRLRSAVCGSISAGTPARSLNRRQISSSKSSASENSEHGASSSGIRPRRWEAARTSSRGILTTSAGLGTRLTAKRGRCRRIPARPEFNKERRLFAASGGSPADRGVPVSGDSPCGSAPPASPAALPRGSGPAPRTAGRRSGGNTARRTAPRRRRSARAPPPGIAPARGSRPARPRRRP